MAFHRIKKYSRQIVSQDCLLSCHLNTIEEIPVFKRAQISGLSLRNQKTGSGGDRSSWLERELDLSGMLVCWHLWNSRAIPCAPLKKKTENQRRTSTKSGERVCQSLLTLRGKALYTAMEKYLLFLMPREIRKKQVLHFSDVHISPCFAKQKRAKQSFASKAFAVQSLSRRQRVSFSTLYVNSALGLCQYNFKDASVLDSLLGDEKEMQNKVLLDFPLLCKAKISSTLSSSRISFPQMDTLVVQSIRNCSQNHLQKEDRVLLSKQSSVKHARERKVESTILESSPLFTIGQKTLSLHCPSVLNSPDIQDIAQSGLMTLEGRLTLEFF